MNTIYMALGNIMISLLLIPCCHGMRRRVEGGGEESGG